MSTGRPSAVFRRLARLLISRPGAPFVLTDLDDAFDRDLGGGVSLPRARRRYAVNVLSIRPGSREAREG